MYRGEMSFQILITLVQNGVQSNGVQIQKEQTLVLLKQVFIIQIIFVLKIIKLLICLIIANRITFFVQYY